MTPDRGNGSRAYSSGGVCVGAQGGRGGKWGSLLVAGIQIQGVITYSALYLPAKIQFVPDDIDNVNLTSQ